MKVTKKTKLAELIKYPKAIEILQGSGMHCIGCMLASQESIEEGMKAHGMSDKEIETIIKEINKAMEEDTAEKTGKKKNG